MFYSCCDPYPLPFLRILLLIHASSELAISLQEQKLLTQIKQQIITLAIKRVVTKLKQDLTISQHVLIINKCITRLGGLVNE